jgi:hypothetical protein
VGVEMEIRTFTLLKLLMSEGYGDGELFGVSGALVILLRGYIYIMGVKSCMGRRPEGMGHDVMIKVGSTLDGSSMP